MIVGYVMEHALGFILAGSVATSSAWKREELCKLFSNLLNRFHDSAAFLCFSIQTAAIVVLIKVDAGISTAGMGDGSVRITEAVSVLTLLPLVYAVVLSKMAPARQPEIEEIQPARASRAVDTDIEETKQFGVMVICWLMAFYPFYSKMNSVFGPSEISDAPGSAISTSQFNKISEVCFDGVDPITPAEDHLMTALAILSYIPLTFFVLGKVVQLALRKHHQQSKFYQKMSSWFGELPWLCWILFAFLGTIPLLGSGLIWTVLRVQQFQSQLAGRVGAGDGDHQWTFGQVVAVTVFASVFVDAWFLGRSFWITRREKETTASTAMNETSVGISSKSGNSSTSMTSRDSSG